MTTYQKCKEKPSRLKFLLVLLLSTLCINMLHAQGNLTVQGKVTDQDTNKPIPNVSVMVKGSSKGVVTDESGNYSITVTAGSTLFFTYLSNTPEEVKVSKAGIVNVTLNTKPKNLDEVMVIGYGTRKKKDVTGSLSTVGAKDIEKSTSLSPELALQGRAAGVFVESGGGSPTARPVVRIRGVNTFGFSEPLYVIDGVPMFEGGAGVSDGAIGDIRSGINIFSMINADDIESMTVLKDASAAAIYGVRASNGVILITTKKGKIGKAHLDVGASYGFQKIPKKIGTLNTLQYFNLLEEAYAANPDANTSFAQRFGPLYDKTNPAYVGNSPTYNWDDALRNNNAPIQNYFAKVSGGSEGTNYYFSGGYSNTASPLINDDVERYTVAANVDSRIGKIFTAGLNIRLIQQNSGNNTGAGLDKMMSTVPFQPIYDKNDPTGYAAAASGTFEDNPAYDPALLDAGAPKLFAPGDPQLLWGPQTSYNPFVNPSLGETQYNLFNTIGNAYVQIEPVVGLKIKGSVGGQYFTNLKTETSYFDSWRFSQTPGNPYSGTDGTTQARMGKREGKTRNLNTELTVNYNHTFNEAHHLDVIIGASNQFSKWTATDLSGNSTYSDPQYISIPNKPPFTQGFWGILQEDALVGYLGRISYNYKSKYYLDLTMRRDGSSRLAPGNKWDNFPSAAASWRISSENFFPTNTFVNDLKLRGSYGQLGNYQSASPYAYLSQVSTTSDYSFGSGNGNPFGTQLQGAALPNFANTSLTWEKVKSLDVGIDALLFDNRVSLTADYYSKTTFDIIQSVALPPNTGIEAPADLNVATVSNKGIELMLGYNLKIGDFNFNTSGNMTTVKNNVVKLNGGTPIGGQDGRIEEGYSMFYLWGYEVDGIFQNQSQIDSWGKAVPDGDANIGGYQYMPGDMYFKNLYGNPTQGKDEQFSPTPDSVVNSYDRTYLGKTIPGYYYGFSFAANWHGFDASLFFQGVGDVQKYNYTRSGLEAMDGTANQWATTLERWSATNPSTGMPRAMFGDPAQFNRFSSRYVEDAGYFRLKNVQIGYTVPQNFLTKSKIAQNIRIYVSGVNLFTATKFSGLDPENSSVPPARQFLFGITAGF